MISKYVREQRRYSKTELEELFECQDEVLIRIMKRLREFGIMKTVHNSEEQKNKSDLADADQEIADEEAEETDHLYVFTFVGIIIVEGRVLKCYPKYLLSKQEPEEELKQIIKVLQKYNSGEQIIRMYNDGGKSTAFNLLAVMVYLMNDYYENGMYVNTQNIIEVNGPGEIAWEKTINETYAVISHNRPYYTELKTRKRINDEHDYFRRLHECILTACSRELKDSDLLNLLDMSEVDLSDECIGDFGDDDYIIYRLQNELNIQFNTRKQLVLKTLETYISHKGSLADMGSFSLFGTNSFQLVWEKVCAEVLNNQLKQPLASLELPVPLKEGYVRTDRLISLVDKPAYRGYREDNTEFEKKAKDTLIPDLVSIHVDNGNYTFIIFDAKYYTMQLEADCELSGHPGVGDVTKQYLYQLAYRRFIEDHHIAAVRNCFLMPTEKDEFIEKGYVRMDMLEALQLEHIQIRQLPAYRMFAYYLQAQKLDIRELNL